MRRAPAVLAAGLLAACGPSGGGGDGETVGLAPTFPAVTTTVSLPAAPEQVVAAPQAVVVDATAPPAPTEAPPPALPEPVAAATVLDPEGDATASVGAPAWADIVQGRLFRRADGFELRVALGGGAAPTGSGSGEHTMNVASFYDVDGDGAIDYEVWANLADGGWDGSWFDDRRGTAAYSDDAGVSIAVEGAEVVLRFPLGHVGDATAFRWSLASEYGTYAALGTDLTARDDAPDGDRPVAFPG